MTKAMAGKVGTGFPSDIAPTKELVLSRRRFLTGFVPAAGAFALTGCDDLSQTPGFRNFLSSAEELTRSVQRFFVSPTSLAREFDEADLSPAFRANGSTDPDDPDYRAHVATGFADWRLSVGGLVERPGEFSLADLRAMPSRTQITRHDCVEGWSCIGKWKGVQLAGVLNRVGLKPEAKFIVLTCADMLEKTLDGSGRYYESIGLEDAFHPQTILAYDMNDQILPVAHGAPVRLRVERQLGYKMAKYVMKIDAVDSLAALGRGKGGFWPDRGYEWYAGI
jgi:DMSO/TMAO reductase YedYZ molybdopterin-dependent catalytic subunit